MSDEGRGCEECGAPPVYAFRLKTGRRKPLCSEHLPRVPQQFLDSYLYTEGLVLPRMDVPGQRDVLELGVLEHIQAALTLLHPLAGMRLMDDERDEHQLVAREAYSVIHNLEKDWLKRLGRPTAPGSVDA